MVRGYIKTATRLSMQRKCVNGSDEKIRNYVLVGKRERDDG